MGSHGCSGRERGARLRGSVGSGSPNGSGTVIMIDAYAGELCMQRTTVHVVSVLFLLNQLFHC